MKHSKDFLSLGKVEIKVGGVYPEVFINRASELGVPIEKAEADGRTLSFITDHPGLKIVRDMEREQGFTLTVLGESGFSYKLRRVWQRKIFLAGFTIFCLLVYYLSGRIWTIELAGLSALNTEEIYDYVKEFGVEKWSSIRNLDLNAIEEGLYFKFPQIAWVAVERIGTKLSIRIEEKSDNPFKQGTIIDIVAAYDGIIFEMMVLKGVPQVSPGMTVAAGDVLIAGYCNGSEVIHAAGSVRGKVFIEGTGQAALVEKDKRYTGNEQEEEILKLWGININLSSPPSYEHYEIEEERVNILKNHIVLLRRRYIELIFETNNYTPQEAEALAQQRALRTAHDQVGNEAKIINKEIEKCSSSNREYCYRVILTIETNMGYEKIQAREE